MAQKYKSKWTGPQVDEAVGNVSKKIDKDSLIGSNGITIKKTDSNIEISGVELVRKTTEASKVYGTDSTGGQALKPFANTPTPSALAAYNDVSNLKTSVPVEDLDCTNKKYVDDAVSKIPEGLPSEDSLIVVKADGSASEYVPRSQVSSDKLDKQTAQTTSDQIYGKLADGSQTMFDVTMGATATTIPRRDTAGRVQVADGVSGNDAVNFNQLSAQKEALEAELNNKQATLVSGTNIKTINGNSLLGSGDLVIESGGTEVTPNPTLSGNEAALSALQIGDTKYRIEGTLTTLIVGIDSSLLGG